MLSELVKYQKFISIYSEPSNMPGSLDSKILEKSLDMKSVNLEFNPNSTTGYMTLKKRKIFDLKFLVCKIGLKLVRLTSNIQWFIDNYKYTEID